MRGLYAIADMDVMRQRGVLPLDFVQALLPARPAALQLRAKSLGARETLELLRAFREPCAAYGVPLFANDRPDLAVLAGCDGVHLGQADLSLVDARQVAPGLALGVSTHCLEELDRALAERPSYVAFGPVFATSSKENAEPVVGLAALTEAGRRCRAMGVPLVAIGGVTLECAARVAQVADAAAIISALLPQSGLAGVEDTAARLHACLRER